MSRLVRRTSVVSAIALVALGACSSSSGGVADAGPVNNGDDAVAGDDGGTCPTRSATSCDDLTMTVPNYMAGVDETPSGFPPPPSGSTLCGTEGVGGLTTTEILLSDEDSSTLINYYANALMVLGDEVMSPVSDQDCSVTLPFIVSSPEAAAPLSGSIVWLPDAQAYEINNPN
jgi:hypothetical protein